MKVGITFAKDKIPSRYMEAAEKAGLIPVLLRTKEEAGRFEEIDCILFAGGGDIAPWRFGQAPHPLAQPPDEERDELEYRLFHLAIEKNLPVLGICRGLQLVNCAMGGDLIQHLPDAHLHNHEKQDLWHEIEISPDTALFSLYGGSTQVNSCHHQAAGYIAPGLRASAVCGQCIEALEGDNLLLVQFHPERMEEAGMPVFYWLKNQTEKRSKQIWPQMN